jgi:hypothetical protein
MPYGRGASCAQPRADLEQASGRFFEKKLRKKLLIPPALTSRGNQKFFGYFFSKK